MASILAQDNVGGWLPFALYDLICCLSTKPPAPEKLFDSWGLAHLAEQIREGKEAENTRQIMEIFAS